MNGIPPAYREALERESKQFAEAALSKATPWKPKDPTPPTPWKPPTQVNEPVPDDIPVGLVTFDVVPEEEIPEVVEEPELIPIEVREDLAVGIDLGTTYSCVGVFRNGKMEIITNEFGNRTTPSFVAFTDDECLVGNAAQNQASRNTANTVFDAKRLIGRNFDDKTIQDDLKHWPFEVCNENGRPQIKTVRGVQTAEEISALILGKMKTVAETHIGAPVSRVVITVPAYFNDAQRKATKDAGKMAGLEVMRIINEPTAAAIAYGLERATKGESHILIFDLGGGTFDVSVLNLSHGIFTVLATGGDTHLGGEDFDHRLVDHVLKKQELSLSGRNLQRLRSACEKAKRTLSSNDKAIVLVEGALNGDDIECSITRDDFELLNQDLFDSCMKCVRNVLQDAGLDKSDIDEVVFVGGSTRIPKILDMVQTHFGKAPNMSINPDEAVAHGAAVQAAILAGHAGETRDRCLLMDVAPLSLGIETAGGLINVLVPRNSTIPCLRTEMFSTYCDNQEEVLVSVFEGERQLCKDNHLLGNFRLTQLPEAKAGIPQIEVTFEVDVDGILHVSALEKSTGVANYIDIEHDSGLTKEDIERLVEEAEHCKDNDLAEVERVEAYNDFERFILQVRQGLADRLEEDNTEMETLIDHALEWLTKEDYTKEDFAVKKRELEIQLEPLLGKLYKQSGIVPGQADAKLIE